MSREGIGYHGPMVVEAASGMLGGKTEREKSNWNKIVNSVEVLAGIKPADMATAQREVREGFLQTFADEFGGAVIPGVISKKDGSVESIPMAAVNYLGEKITNFEQTIGLAEKLSGGDLKRLENYQARFVGTIVNASQNRPDKVWSKVNALKGVERWLNEKAMITEEPEVKKTEPVMPVNSSSPTDDALEVQRQTLEEMRRLTKLMERGGGGGITGGTDAMNKMAKYQELEWEAAREEMELRHEVRDVSLEELLDAYLQIKAPRERSPQRWEYVIPDWAAGINKKDWRLLLSFEDSWLGAIYGKRSDGGYNNSLDELDKGILNKPPLAEEDLQYWYDHKQINLKGVMKEIMHELLEPKYMSATIDGKVVTRKIYAFKQNGDEYTGHAAELAFNSGEYKIALANRLAQKKVVANENLAKMSVALAMDMFEYGGVFTVADTLRRLGWESDAMRLAQRPETKFNPKVEGGEIWGGPWTEYGLALVPETVRGMDARGTEAQKIVADLGIVPQLLSGSFIDMVPRGSAKSLADMIYDGEQINFKGMAMKMGADVKSSNDMYFGWRKDHIKPAISVWNYITRKAPFEMSRGREFDNVVTDWRTGLYNDILELRNNKKHPDCLLTIQNIAGAIGGSVGMWPFAGPYLRLSPRRGEGTSFNNQMAIARQIVEGLALSMGEQRVLLDFFGVGQKYARDFAFRINDYGTTLNPRTSPDYMHELKANLRKPRR